MRMNARSLFSSGETPYVEGVTTAAAPMTVLYDGDCRFCTQSAHTIRRRFGRERVALRNFQEPGALEDYPRVTHDAAMKKMHVVLRDGRVFAGAEAFARIFLSLRFVGWIAWLYYVPGVRQLADLAYATIAKHRYRLFGRTGQCDGGTCHLHGA
jgi:predicted DCC family thiol-disulfide oxidoreductase YuxK